MSTYAKIIADSISPDGTRLTTMEVRFHRFILAEFNTHRVFSRSSASSRAIPFHKQLDLMDKLDCAYPVEWPTEQSGMQGGVSLSNEMIEPVRDLWKKMAQANVKAANALVQTGLHKSVANRLLEPFMWHTVVVTSTAWQNFFELRNNVMAQPEIHAVAALMEDAYGNSTPVPIQEGDWHLPYVDSEVSDTQYSPRFLAKISAARCARVSYLTQDGTRDISKDLELYERLVTNGHWAPLEHAATPWAENRQESDAPLFWLGDENDWVQVPIAHLPRVGNFLGWRQLRCEVESEQERITFQ